MAPRRVGLMNDVTLDSHCWPALEAVDQAFVERWLVSEGEAVRAGELLARVRLMQQTVEVVAPHNGVLETIFIPAGERFGQGAVLARVLPW